MEESTVDLVFLLPYTNENRWSDLLATLIQSDPGPLVSLGLLAEGDLEGGIRVTRERSVDREDWGRDRIDIEVRSARKDTPLIAIECKVLSDLGPNQLDRYSKTHAAPTQVLLSLGHRHYGSDVLKVWRSLLWRDVIDAFARSSSEWVRHTAEAWSSYLSSEDALDETLRWDEALADSGNAIHDLQRKAAYLCAHVDNGFFLGSSNAGGKPLLVWRTEVPGRPGTYVMAEVEDAWSRGTFRLEDGRIEGVGGVVAFFGIRREYEDAESDTSYDVDDLTTLWNVIKANEKTIEWSHYRPGKKIEADQRQFDELWAKGALPLYMGKGYRGGDYCEYGLKTKRVGAGQTLRDISNLLSRLGDLGQQVVDALARH